MADYKLIYFNGRGRAEIARYIFAHAEVRYEDERLHGNDQWAILKPSTPWKCLPVLEVEGKKIGGSNVIARFLAERFGLAGEGDIQKAEIAAAADAVSDLADKMIKIHFEQEDLKKEELIKDFKATILPLKLGSFEEQIKKNGSKDGWLFTATVSWADMQLHIATELLENILPDALGDYPGVTKLKESVENLPNIKRWIMERPVTIH